MRPRAAAAKVRRAKRLAKRLDDTAKQLADTLTALGVRPSLRVMIPKVIIPAHVFGLVRWLHIWCDNQLTTTDDHTT